ncbi:MAG: msbA 3, partial [Clostridia bacterium]|nr:msbA 3 [Clostridia bacterium]
MKKEKKIENKEKIKQLSFIKLIFRILPMAFSACPVYFIIINLIAIIHGVSHGFNTFVTQQFFDSVTTAVEKTNNGEASGITYVLLMATALGLTAIGVQILNGVHNFMSGNYFRIATGYLNGKINSKTAKIPPVSFENTALLDDINKAGQGMGNSLGLIFTVITLFTFYVPYYIFMSVYLYTLKPILAVSIIIIFIPVFFSQLIRGTVFTKLEDKAAPIRREFDYYEQCICSR